MSTTYSLVCDDCQQRYCVGQSGYLYNPNLTIKILLDHTGYRLRFLNDLVEDEQSEQYEDVEVEK